MLLGKKSKQVNDAVSAGFTVISYFFGMSVVNVPATEATGKVEDWAILGLRDERQIGA